MGKLKIVFFFFSKRFQENSLLKVQFHLEGKAALMKRASLRLLFPTRWMEESQYERCTGLSFCVFYLFR
jgi:hypothetical protein